MTREDGIIKAKAGACYATALHKKCIAGAHRSSEKMNGVQNLSNVECLLCDV